MPMNEFESRSIRSRHDNNDTKENNKEHESITDAAAGNQDPPIRNYS